MLHRHIKIAAKFWVGVELFQNIFRKSCRECVHQPHPFNAVNVSKPLKQRRENPFAVQIESIVCAVLSDKYQLFHAKSREAFSVQDNSVHRLADMPPSHQWDRTERTGAVAAFRDFEVGKMLWCCKIPLAEQLVFVIAA